MGRQKGMAGTVTSKKYPSNKKYNINVPGTNVNVDGTDVSYGKRLLGKTCNIRGDLNEN